MMGATISSALAREHLVLTAEFMKGDELSSIVGPCIVRRSSI